MLARTFRLKALTLGDRKSCGSGITNDTGSAVEDGITNSSDVHVKLLQQKSKIKGLGLVIREPIRLAVQADEVVIGLAWAYDAIAVPVYEYFRN